jgi:hypothetical protein
MTLNRSIAIRFVLLISLMASLTVLSSRLQADTGNCGAATGDDVVPRTTLNNEFAPAFANAFVSRYSLSTTALGARPRQSETDESIGKKKTTVRV